MFLTERISSTAALGARLAVLLLVGQAALSASVIYTFVESLPAQSAGDLPTATWTLTLSTFLTADTGTDFDPPPVLNGDAIADGFIFTGSFGPDISTADTDTDLSYLDPTGVTFSLGSATFSPLDSEDCQPVLSQTACVLAPPPSLWTVSDGPDQSSAQVDLVSVEDTSSVPEPSAWTTTLLGLFAVSLIALRKARRRGV